MQFGQIIDTLKAELAVDVCWVSLSAKEKTSYIKAVKPPKKPKPAKPNRANRFSWSDSDVEHHPKPLKPLKAHAWSEKELESDDALEPTEALPSYHTYKPIPKIVGDVEPRNPLKATKPNKANLDSMLMHSKPLFKTDPKSANEWSPSKSHLAALEDYKEGNNWNKLLRTKRAHPGAAAGIENLKHLTSHQMVAPEVVYRGNKMQKLHTVGHRFTDRGFSGTSFDPNVVDEHSRDHHIFAIHVPKDTKGYYLDQHDNMQDSEKELTLHPDTHYEVIGHTVHKADRVADWMNNDPYIVTHLAVVGQGRKGKTDKPDFSLTQSPAGKKWLAEVKASLPMWFKKKPKAAKVEYIKKHPGGKIAKTLAKKPPPKIQ